MNTKQKAIIAAIGLALTFGSVASASAETRWEHNHPRRDQVIDRLHRQNMRIRDERREGGLTGQQARSLHAADRSIFRQEQADARANGGHITKSEQHALNQEENGVSKQIGR